MFSLEIYKKIPITKYKNDVYTSIACTPQFYYFCDPNCCQIVQYNHCYEYVKSIKVKRSYTKICYDHKKKCFYAIAHNCYHKIFILNEHFDEIDSIPICFSKGCTLTSIDYYRGYLYIACRNIIYKLSTHCYENIETYLEVKSFFSAITITPNHTITANQAYRNELINVFHENKKHLFTVCLPCCYHIQDMTYCNDKIYILVSKDCEYNFILICDIQCHHSDKPQSCTDVIESIALIEASLSHILNAEGEKLQKIIASTNDPDIILDVNEAVNKTIINITHLEQVLYSKLESAKTLCKKSDL